MMMLNPLMIFGITLAIKFRLQRYGVLALG